MGPTTGNWSGTATLSWHGSGTDPISGGVDTIDGTQTITWIPGTSSLDGISFQMVATSVVFTYNETHTSGYTQGACSAHEVWQESGTVTLTGADADKQAHGFMTVVPLAAGSSLADYTSGIPGASIELPFTDDTTSDCTAPSHLQGLTGASATPSSMTGTIQANATTISDGTTYTVDGGGFPVTYTASWNLQKM